MFETREVLESVLTDARSIDYTDNAQVDSYVDSIISTVTKALEKLKEV